MEQKTEKETKRKEITPISQPGLTGMIEQFLYSDPELRQFVVYTYYDRDWNLLYIGRSRNFYNAHLTNMQRLSYALEIRYVGFVFFLTEASMIRAKKVYKNQPDLLNERFIVERTVMEKQWQDLCGNLGRLF